METSPDFLNWTLWDVPDNVLWLSAATFPDTITGPFSAATNHYFRVKLIQP